VREGWLSLIGACSQYNARLLAHYLAYNWCQP